MTTTAGKPYRAILQPNHQSTLGTELALVLLCSSSRQEAVVGGAMRILSKLASYVAGQQVSMSTFCVLAIPFLLPTTAWGLVVTSK